MKSANLNVARFCFGSSFQVGEKTLKVVSRWGCTLALGLTGGSKRRVGSMLQRSVTNSSIENLYSVFSCLLIGFLVGLAGS